jgi:hypothetical protein
MPDQISSISSGGEVAEGAPEWVVKQWITLLASKPTSADAVSKKRAALSAPLLKLLSVDLARRSEGTETAEDSIISLMEPVASDADEDSY